MTGFCSRFHCCHPKNQLKARRSKNKKSNRSFVYQHKSSPPKIGPSSLRALLKNLLTRVPDEATGKMKPFEASLAKKLTHTHVKSSETLVYACGICISSTEGIYCKHILLSLVLQPMLDNTEIFCYRRVETFVHRSVKKDNRVS